MSKKYCLLVIIFFFAFTISISNAQEPTPTPEKDPSEIFLDPAKELLRGLFNLGNPENPPPGQNLPPGQNQPGQPSGKIADFLPNPLNPMIDKGLAKRNEILNLLAKYPENKALYLQLQGLTGIPWQVFAGIHLREGGMNPQKSVVSGRFIGRAEPDVCRSVGCSSGSTGPGVPVPVPRGEQGCACGFKTPLDAGIYGANLLKSKVKSQGGIKDYQTLIMALSRYNGGGNRNCGQASAYKSCPGLFEGEDDDYVMNFLDARHAQMYIIFCFDGKRCPIPKPDTRAGTFTLIRSIADAN